MIAGRSRNQTIAQTNRYLSMNSLASAGTGQAWDEIDFVAQTPDGATVLLPAAATAAIKLSQPSDDVQAFLGFAQIKLRAAR